MAARDEVLANQGSDERLWEANGAMLRSRRFEFPVEREDFVTVLRRLLAPGSDRAAERRLEDYVVAV